MWDLVPWPGIEPGPSTGSAVLATGPPGKSDSENFDTMLTSASPASWRTPGKSGKLFLH